MENTSSGLLEHAAWLYMHRPERDWVGTGVVHASGLVGVAHVGVVLWEWPCGCGTCGCDLMGMALWVWHMWVSSHGSGLVGVADVTRVCGQRNAGKNVVCRKT